MPGTYRARGIVLRRTKLGESDLIVTLLVDGTHQVRAVAKGARKPASRTAGAVNLGNEVELLLHQGRSLDTVAEARIVTARAGLAAQVERLVMAEAVLDTVAELTAEGDHDARLLPLTAAALDVLLGVPEERLPLVGAAFVLKAVSMEGMRPSLDACACCGEPVDLAPGGRVLFVALEGGALCSACAHAVQGRLVPAELLAWARALLAARFSDLGGPAFDGASRQLATDLLAFARAWLAYHPGVHPRALAFALETALP